MRNPNSCASLVVTACLTTACIDSDEPVGEDATLEAPERQRMRQYLDDLYEADAVAHEFESRSGETIDCVPLDEQPGLRRAEMAGHEILFEPRNLPHRENRPRAPAIDLPATQEYILPGEYDNSGAERACPEGTIPILRLTMDTLTRFATLEDFRRKAPQLGPSNLHQYAHAYRHVANLGAESRLNLWSPHVQWTNEFSLSQIWVTRGHGNTLETVETGWQTYSDLYGDFDARLFIYFTPDNYGSGGCYNLACPAFVQVDGSVVIGGKYSSYSTTKGPQYDIGLFWYKDGVDGHWWLMHQGVWVGYYPRTLFDAHGLRDHAALIDFGGEIIDALDGIHTHTDMGSGAFASLGWAQAAYQRNLRYVDAGNSWQEATGLTASHTNCRCYDILLYDAGDWMNHFYFGGSGYNAECK